MRFTDYYSFIARIGELISDKSLSDKEKILLVSTWWQILKERENSSIS
jgi:hypothetical protein